MGGFSPSPISDEAWEVLAPVERQLLFALESHADGDFGIEELDKRLRTFRNAYAYSLEHTQPKAVAV